MASSDTDEKRRPMKIAVLLSGGVDSSVALALLQLTRTWGHVIKAFYLKIWLQDEFMELGNCPWEEDLDYAEKVCSKFDIPLEVISLQEEYWRLVVETSIEEIRFGHTPNPDMYCNSKIKFGIFLNKIGDEYDRVASGHYARLHRHELGIRLSLGRDLIKDQTYFLSYLTIQQLNRCLFPLGSLRSVGELGLKYFSETRKSGFSPFSGFTSHFNFPQIWEHGFSKSEVRKLACYFELPNQNRKDSQGICFLGRIRFSDFIRYHLGEKSGEIIEYETKKVLGEHNGYWYYTIGQRQGLGLSGGPWYVVDKDISNNRIFISRREPGFDTKRFYNFTVTNINWLEKTEQEFTCKVKVRHGKKALSARVVKTTSTTALVILDVPDWGTATGQFAVFYLNNVCLGGGVINF